MKDTKQIFKLTYLTQSHYFKFVVIYWEKLMDIKNPENSLYLLSVWFCEYQGQESGLD